MGSTPLFHTTRISCFGTARQTTIVCRAAQQWIQRSIYDKTNLDQPHLCRRHILSFFLEVRSSWACLSSQIHVDEPHPANLGCSSISGLKATTALRGAAAADNTGVASWDDESGIESLIMVKSMSPHSAAQARPVHTGHVTRSDAATWYSATFTFSSASGGGGLDSQRTHL